MHTATAEMLKIRASPNKTINVWNGFRQQKAVKSI